MAGLELAYTPAATLAAMIRRRQVSPVEVVANALARIEETAEALNAFCAVHAEDALAGARAAENALMRGGAVGPLHGVPVAIKDFTPTGGYTTTRGSLAFRDHVPETDAVVVERLKGAGAVMVGKTNTPEFAMSGFTRNRLFGETRNPWNLTHTPGGSSGGSAAAVAAGCVPLAEGSDAGGSIREPAACCGIVGLKPSLGRIPFDILPTQFWTVFHFGPLARTVADAALFLDVTNGPDDRDVQSLAPRLEVPVPPPADIAGLKVALNIDYGFFWVDPEVEAATRAAAAALGEAGAAVEEVELAFDREAIYSSEADFEAYAALELGALPPERRALLTERVRGFVERGRERGGVEVKRHELARTETWKALAPVLREHDVLLCPTQAGPAPLNSQSEADFDWVDEDGRYRGHFMAQYFSFVGQLPALSVPSGFASSGLPIGLQIVAGRWDDNMALRVAQALEDRLDWPRRRPPL